MLFSNRTLALLLQTPARGHKKLDAGSYRDFLDVFKIMEVFNAFVENH